jgi:hypothetical protein
VLLEKAGPALGSRFGGIWIDEQDHGRIKVGMVGAKAADREWVDAQGFRGAADVVEVPRSLSDLEAAAEWLWSRAVALNQDTVDSGSSWTLAVSITPRRSTANLYIPPVAHRSEQQRAFIEEARMRLGSALFVEEYETPPHEGACTIALPPYCDPPLRAGIAIDYPADCTGGFPARSRSDNKLYLFTAGHCTRNRPDTWWTWFPDGTQHDIGPVHNCIAGRGPANSCGQGYGDYAILRVLNPSGWDQGRGWVFVRTSDPNAGEDGTTRDTAYEINDALRVSEGWRVCKSGRHGTSCGRVVELNVGYTSVTSGYSYDFLASANYCGQEGDSGGPIDAFHHAYGIHQGGGDDCTKFFQSIVNAQDGMNVDIILAP